jgi:hypothetical protein
MWKTFAALLSVTCAFAAEVPSYRIAGSPSAGYYTLNLANRMAVAFPPGATEYAANGRQLRLTLEGYGRVTRATASGARLDRVYSSGLREWFANDAGGLEQGFVIAKRESAHGLIIRLEVSDGWQITAGPDHATFTRGETRLDYAGLKAWDARGIPLPARLRAESQAVVIEADDSSAVYPVTIDPTTQNPLNPTQQLIPADGAANDNFGSSSALSKNGSSLVTGSPNHAVGNNSQQGAAYVYALSSAGFNLAQELTAGDGLASDNYGKMVAISGDGSTIAVAAPNHNAGAVYVYRLNQSAWSLEKELTPADGASGDLFGTGMALSDNGNTLIVGSPFHRVNLGAGYVYTRTGTIWAQTAQLTAANPVAPDTLGSSVTLNGAGTLAVLGMPFHLIGFNNLEGGAIVFSFNGASWSQTQVLIGSDSAAFDTFGSQAALSDDGSTLAIAALGKGSFTGAVYMFQPVSGMFVQQQELSPTVVSAYFGQSLALSSDGTLLAVGEPAINIAQIYVEGASSGTRPLLAPAGTQVTWSPLQQLTVPGSGANDDLGWSVGCNSGLQVCVSGADMHTDTNSTGEGTVYVFEADTLSVDNISNQSANQPFLVSVRVNRSDGGTDTHATGQVSLSVGSGCTIQNSPVSVVNGIAPFSLDCSTSGQYTVTASENGFPSVTSNQFTVSSGLITTTTSVTASPNPGIYGQILNLTATVAPVPPNGVSVTFNDGSTLLGTGTLTGGIASLPISTLILGSHSISANFPGIGNFGMSTSPSITVNIFAPANAGKVGVFLPPGTGPCLGNYPCFQLDRNGDTSSTGDAVVPFTGLPSGYQAGDIPIPGDWTGDGHAKVGVYRSATGQWFLDTNNNGVFDAGDTLFSPGVALGDKPVTGDWTGVGKSCMGLFRSGFFWVLDLNCNGAFDDGSFVFPTGGVVGDVPVTGIWAGSTTRVGVANTSALPFTWVLDTANANDPNQSHHVPTNGINFGSLPGSIPVVGNFFGDGFSHFGVASPSGGFLLWQPDAAIPTAPQVNHVPGGSFLYGVPGSVPVVGGWSPQWNTTTSLGISPNPANLGQTVTFTATVLPPTAPGSVTFSDELGTLGTATVSSGFATLMSSNLPLGTHSVIAAFSSGDSNNYLGSNAPVISLTIGSSIPTTTSLTASPNPSLLGEKVILTATVSPSTATGSVTFMDGLNFLGSATVSNGVATLSVSSLAVGTHSLSADYSGDSTHTGSISNTVSQVVNRLSNAFIVLEADPNPSIVGQDVLMVAHFRYTGPVTPTGTITFFDGGTQIGIVTLTANAEEFSISTLDAGPHPLTAVYSGDSNYAPCTSNIVNQMVTFQGYSLSGNVTSNGSSGIGHPAVEGVAAVTPAAAGLNGVTIDVNGSTATSTVTDSSGNYSVTVAAGGNYTLSAAAKGYNFGGPVTYTNLSSNQTATNFTGATVAGLEFVPVSPCRLVDTRVSSFQSGFGPPSMSAGQTRTFNIPTNTACGIPSTAAAYSLNVTVVTKGYLGILTIWPAGQPMPNVSTLNSYQTTSTAVANAAIVPAGTNGAINVYVTDATDLIIDINGYFAANPSGGYEFFPVTPCRLVDTRVSSFPSGFGPPSMSAGTIRSFTIPSDAACTIPSTAAAYSLNVTAVPRNTLGILSIWPTGQPLPNVSTLNVYNAGTVVANAAIVPAGSSGAISAYVTDTTDLVIDINGYFAPIGGNGLKFYPATPCRISDTRVSSFPFGLGPPTMSAGETRSFTVPQSTCGIPPGAGAYSFNFTAVPQAPQLGIFITWPTGLGQPNVSTMNSYNGSVVANAAIVPAGTGGAISIYVTDMSDGLFDVNGYFAP